MSFPRMHVLLLLTLLCTALGCQGRSGGVETGGNRVLIEREIVEDPVLRVAAALIDGGRGDKAFKQLVDRFRNQPQAAHPDVALWLAANALIEDGERIRAFYYLDQLMDEHPGSPLYFAAATKQFEIADSYLRNKSDRAFFFFPYRHHDEALEMLFRVQQRVPGSPLAERALKRSADFYFAAGDYDFAEDAYGVFIDRYPRSPEIPIVRLKQAFSNIEQYNGPRYDPTPLLDAATQLRQFAAEFPELAREQKIPEVLAWIDEQLAEKLMLEADYYRRTGEGRASRLLLAQVSESYPQTRHAIEARRRLERSAASESPTTMPASASGEEAR